MPPRLPWRLLPQSIHSSFQQSFTPPSFLLPSLHQHLFQAQTKVRAASILASLSDNPAAYNKRIRRGRGPASGKGKTSGRGHKGQGQRGTKPAFFNGGQTRDIDVHGERGFTNRFSPTMSRVNLDRVQEWIDQGRIDPSQPITLRELCKSRCIHGIKDGIKLLGRGGTDSLKQPLTVVVSRASASAIEAVEAAGGTITTRYYTKHAIKRILKGKTDPFISLAWTDPFGEKDATTEEAGVEGASKTLNVGMGQDKPLVKGNGFQYRLPDPTNRSDIEYYRDPAHRGYLSHLVGEGEGPSLFFTPPTKEGQKAKKTQKSAENRVW